jgi:hypothetical protein
MEYKLSQLNTDIKRPNSEAMYREKIMVHPVLAYFLKSTGLTFLHGYKILMRNDHLYRNHEYSGDEYIQA